MADKDTRHPPLAPVGVMEQVRVCTCNLRSWADVCTPCQHSSYFVVLFVKRAHHKPLVTKSPTLLVCRETRHSSKFEAERLF